MCVALSLLWGGKIMNNNNLTFPQLLKFHRFRLDITQSAVASLLQTPLRTYQSWELGNNAPNKITQQVAVATLEGLRTNFLPTKAKEGRPSANREVIVLEPAPRLL